MVRVYIPVELAAKVRAAAKERCGYCLSPQYLILGPVACSQAANDNPEMLTSSRTSAARAFSR
jgi:hypothetical protein